MTIPLDEAVTLPCMADRLLIHRPPMLLIDSLLTRDGDGATACAQISEDSPAYSPERGILPEYFIELIAQTMAAANGYDNLGKNTAPREGYIVGLDRFSLTGLPELGDKLTIEIHKDMEFGAMRIVSGKVLCKGRLLSSAELKVWEKEPDEG